jgi:hypothetical protein
MKARLFSKGSIIVALKGLASSIVSGLTSFVFVAVAYWLINLKQMYAVGGLLLLFTMLWQYLFWGYLNRIWWKWN